MASHGVSFESTSYIEERKDSKRQAREEVIEKAKQQYEKEERRKELKRQRGEDTWMLPEINQRLQEIEEEGSAKSKKKKEKKSKKKKEKKKKSKKEKKTAEDGPNDSSEDSGDEWVEAQTQAAKAWQVPDESKPSESNLNPAQNVERDEWMTFDFLAMKTTSTAEKRAVKDRLKEEERAKAQAIEQAGLHKLELNPYWKDGGTGLPPEQMAAAKKGNNRDQSTKTTFWSQHLRIKFHFRLCLLILFFNTQAQKSRRKGRAISVSDGSIVSRPELPHYCNSNNLPALYNHTLFIHFHVCLQHFTLFALPVVLFIPNFLISCPVLPPQTY
ncbi:CWF19-like protein 2 [Anarrhichthys ocellatus]|uniref:CWF19-like protein 2 n=1 Tax=Anarrhichthys ocellatus TaxID=433405 RepID=UPI0012ED4ABE|nr:CWF19-like protein 2 [Anarrhichthys ocellatus]